MPFGVGSRPAHRPAAMSRPWRTLTSRYRTVPIWWDRETMLEQSDAAHLLMLAREREDVRTLPGASRRNRDPCRGLSRFNSPAMSPSEAAAHSAVILDRRKSDQAIQIERLIADGVHVRDDTVTLDRFRTLVPAPQRRNSPNRRRDWAYFPRGTRASRFLGPTSTNESAWIATGSRSPRTRSTGSGTSSQGRRAEFGFLDRCNDGPGRTCGHLRLADFGISSAEPEQDTTGSIRPGLNKSVAAAGELPNWIPTFRSTSDRRGSPTKTSTNSFPAWTSLSNSAIHST